MCDVLKCETPYMLGYKSKLQILPRGGWKSHTYYVVDVAFNVNNPIHRKIFYTGFIDIDGNPQGYNGFARFDRGDSLLTISDAYYIKVIREINIES